MDTVIVRLRPPLRHWTTPDSLILTVTFNLPVPVYFFQVNTIENISNLQFVTSLVALASGVIGGGSLAANFVSYLLVEMKRRLAEERGGAPSKQLEVPLLYPEAV